MIHKMLRKYRMLLTLSSIIILSLIISSVAYASLGQLQDCNVNTPSTLSLNLDDNDLASQSFTPSSSYTISGAKLNIFQYAGSPATTFSFFLTDVAPATGGRPDVSSILTSGSFSTTDLPVWDTTTANNNIFSCDFSVRSGQSVEFSSPVALSSSTEYALVISRTGGGTGSNLIRIQYTGSDNGYAGGNAYECLQVVSCTSTTPGTWDTIAGSLDLGFATYDTIVTPAVSDTVDRWIFNFLGDFLGLDSPAGYAIFVTGLMLVIGMFLFTLKVPALFILAILGFTTGTAVLAILIPPSVFLALLAMSGIGILLLITFGRKTGAED